MMETFLGIMTIVREIIATSCLVIGVRAMVTTGYRDSDALNWLVLAGLCHFWMGLK